MRQVITALIAMTCLVFLAWEPTQAQQPKTVTVGFRNRTDSNVLVKGYTVVNGTQRVGQLMQLRKSGGMAFENSVLAGVRFVTVYDAITTRVLLRDFPVPIQNRDISFDIVPAPLPGQPTRITLVPIP